MIASDTLRLLNYGDLCSLQTRQRTIDPVLPIRGEDGNVIQEGLAVFKAVTDRVARGTALKCSLEAVRVETAVLGDGSAGSRIWASHW